MYMTEELQKKWQPVLDHPELQAISDPYKKAVTALVLENQQAAMRQDRQALNETSDLGPTNTIGGGSISTFDPILISLVRRALPNLIAYDVAGVQPMTGPTGLIFAMRARYAGQANTNPEAFFNEANTQYTGTGSANNLYGFANNTTGDLSTNPIASLTANAFTTGVAMPTAVAELLGSDVGNVFQQMAFSIEKVTVTAQSRALKAEYCLTFCLQKFWLKLTVKLSVQFTQLRLQVLNMVQQLLVISTWILTLTVVGLLNVSKV
jgi:hypothetical protein